MGRKNHYCEQCKKSGGGESHFMSGAVLGALVGAALGVLFAPAPGEKTRKKLKDVSEDLSVKGHEVLEKAEVIVDEVKMAAAPLMDELEKNMAPVLKKAKASGKDVQFQVLEKIEQLVDEAEDVADDASKRAKQMFKNTKK
ncbi:YtxH domain-containing protein [candidate division WWE3 bacterium]|nr:YtxH domain-containing protein [candidate division WWE3 bacterium]